MPSRFVTLAIFVFWLATTGWMVYREVLPSLLETGEPPPFTIDLADEVSAQAITWKVLQKGEEIGMARTAVHRQPDRTFLLAGEFKPQHLKPFGIDLKRLGIDIKKLQSTYAVTRAGDLRALEARVALVSGTTIIEVRLHGQVEKGMFTPAIAIEGLEMKGVRFPRLSAVPVSGHGSVLNPLHPLNRLKGLREGQHWVQPLIDPLAAALEATASSMPWMFMPSKPALRDLHARVEAAVLAWDGADVACWKIGYREPGKDESARTWVRRSDGLVLQQEATQAGMELVLQRLPNR
jgi:hypothetical protein